MGELEYYKRQCEFEKRAKEECIEIIKSYENGVDEKYIKENKELKERIFELERFRDEILLAYLSLKSKENNEEV